MFNIHRKCLLILVIGILILLGLAIVLPPQKAHLPKLFLKHISSISILGLNKTSTASNNGTGKYDSYGQKTDSSVTCTQAVKNIYYVKTHKTGSESVVTLLHNFARRHGLITYPTEFDPFPGYMNHKAFRKVPEFSSKICPVFYVIEEY